MSLLQFLPIFFILLFTFTRIIDIRVTKSEELTVKINLNIFAILLTEERIKRRGFRKVGRLVKSLKNLLKPLEYLISRTEIRIYKLSSPLSNGSTVATPYSLPFFVSLSVILSYIERYAKVIRFIKQKDSKANDEDTFWDFSFHFSLWNLIIFVLLFLYYTVKSKVKKVIKNV